MKVLFAPLALRRFFPAVFLAATVGFTGLISPAAQAFAPVSIIPKKDEARQWVESADYYSLAKGSSRLQANRPGQALDDLLTTLEKNPVNILGLFQLGNAYLELAKASELQAEQNIFLEQAQQAFERVLNLNDELILTYFRLGKVALMRNQPDLAKHYYQLGAKVEPDNAAMLFNLARVQDQMGEREAAIEGYLQTLRVDPHFTYAHNNLGLLYQEKKEWIKAEKAYLNALKETPDYNLARLNLGNLYAMQERYAEAEKIFQLALEQEPTNEWVYYYQGNLHLRQGHYAQAIQAYQQVLNLNPQQTITYYLLAVSLSKLNRMDEALQAGLQYMSLAPTGEYAAEMKSLILSVKLSQEHPLVLQKVPTGNAGMIPVKQ